MKKIEIDVIEITEERPVCGAYAIRNFLKSVRFKGKLESINQIYKKIGVKQGISVAKMMEYIFKQGYPLSVKFNPKKIDIIRSFKRKNYPILNIRIGFFEYHWINIIKIEKNYVYLCNVFDFGEARFSEEYKIHMKDFNQFQKGFLIFLDY